MKFQPFTSHDKQGYPSIVTRFKSDSIKRWRIIKVLVRKNRRNFVCSLTYTVKFRQPEMKQRRPSRNILRTFSYTPEYPGKCCRGKTNQQPKSGETGPRFHWRSRPRHRRRDRWRNIQPEYAKAAAFPFGRRLHAYFLTGCHYEIIDPFLQRSNSLTHWITVSIRLDRVFRSLD